MQRSLSIALLLLVVSTSILAGCSASSNTAHQAVEGYIQALVAKDANKAISLSCANWESQAQMEVDSFAAVTVKLDSLTCQDSGKDGSNTLVSCKGKIISTYNNENQVIDLSARTYQAVQEGNQWRMCGYK